MICTYVSFLEICWCTNGSRWSIEKPSKRAPCSGTGDPSEQQTKASSRSKESSSPSGTTSEKDANASGSKILLSWYYTCFLRPVSGEFAPICIMLGYVQCIMIKKEINKICLFVCVCVCVCCAGIHLRLGRVSILTKEYTPNYRVRIPKTPSQATAKKAPKVWRFHTP